MAIHTHTGTPKPQYSEMMMRPSPEVDNTELCVLCFTPFRDTILSPCNHMFHASCLRNSRYGDNGCCPICFRTIQGAKSIRTPEPSICELITLSILLFTACVCFVFVAVLAFEGVSVVAGHVNINPTTDEFDVPEYYYFSEPQENPFALELGFTYATHSPQTAVLASMGNAVAVIANQYTCIPATSDIAAPSMGNALIVIAEKGPYACLPHVFTMMALTTVISAVVLALAAFVTA